MPTTADFCPATNGRFGSLAWMISSHPPLMDILPPSLPPSPFRLSVLYLFSYIYTYISTIYLFISRSFSSEWMCVFRIISLVIHAREPKTLSAVLSSRLLAAHELLGWRVRGSVVSILLPSNEPIDRSNRPKKNSFPHSRQQFDSQISRRSFFLFQSFRERLGQYYT